MPAILSNPAEIELWLSGEPWSERLKALIRPFEGDLECYAVDRGVGKVQNDSEDFVKVRVPLFGLELVFAEFSDPTRLTYGRPGIRAAARAEEGLARFSLCETSRRRRWLVSREAEAAAETRTRNPASCQQLSG